MESVKSILRVLEEIMRGRRVDEDGLLRQSKDIFTLFSTQNRDEIEGRLPRREN